MKTGTLRVFPLVGLLLMPVALAQEAMSLRKYDLRFLLAREAEISAAQRMTPGESSDLRSGGVSEESVAVIEPADFMALLLGELDRGSSDDLRGPRLSLTESGILLATADTKSHERIAALVAQYRAFLLEQVVLEMHVLPGSAVAGAAGLLRKEEADRLLSGSPPHPVFVSPAKVRRSQLLQSNHDQAYVRDYDVEVAQGSNIPDPKVDIQLFGNGWRVWLDHGLEGRLLVRVHGEQAEPDGAPVLYPVRSRDIKNQEVTSLLHLPRNRITQQWTQAMLGDGEALVFGSTERGSVCCLRLRRPRAAAAPSGADWTTQPVGCLVRGFPRWGMFSWPRLQAPGDDTPWMLAEDLESRPRVLDAGLLADTLRECLGGEAGRSLNCESGLLTIRAPEAEMRAVRERLTLLAADAARQVTVEVRYGKIDAKNVAAVLDPRADVGELAGRLQDTCLIASLLDGWFAFRGGKELSIVRDYDVEIAQDSAVPNPVIGLVFTGLTFHGQVLPVIPDQYRLELHVGFAELDGAIEAFDTKDNRFGDIALPKLRNVHFTVTPIVDGNRWTLLQIAAIPGSDEHLVMVARVRE